VGRLKLPHFAVRATGTVHLTVCIVGSERNADESTIFDTGDPGRATQVRLNDPCRSRHDNDDRCIASPDKSSAQGTGEVVARLGRSPDDDQIGVGGAGDPQELRDRVPSSVDEGEVDAQVLGIDADQVAQLSRAIGHRLFDCPVGNCGPRKRGGSRG